jgi:hypothetical protein
MTAMDLAEIDAGMMCVSTSFWFVRESQLASALQWSASLGFRV